MLFVSFDLLKLWILGPHEDLSVLIFQVVYATRGVGRKSTVIVTVTTVTFAVTKYLF